MAKFSRIVFLAAGMAWAQDPASKPVPPPAVDKAPAPGMGDLTVAPNRLFLEGRKRSDELLLINSGLRTATYRLTMVEMVMAEDGTLAERKEKVPGRITGEDLLRFSPRQVTLEPGATQTVRISLRKPADLPEGEYRCHLLMRAVPETDAVDSAAPVENTPAGFSVKLTPVYGVAVPIVVRHGTTSGTVTWENATVKRDPQSTRLEASLARKGNQSVYGNLRVVFTPAAGGQPIQVITLNQTAVYDNLVRRRYSFELLDLDKKPLGPGTLDLRFLHPETDRPLAETRLEIR